MGADGGNHFTPDKPEACNERDAEGRHGDGRHGNGALADGLVFSTSRMAANGPMALAISFEPWLKAKPEAVTTCIQLKRI